MDQAFRGLAKGDDAGIEAADQAANRHKIQGAILADIKTVTHDECVVSPRRNTAAAAGPVSVEKFAARLVHAFISMRAEEIALRLQQVGGQAFGAVAIVESQRRGKGWGGNAKFDRCGHGLRQDS